MNSSDNYYFICTNQTPEGFYFENNSYKPCYYKCKACFGAGNDSIHNCEICFDDYELMNRNCICPIDYFYFTEDNKCPDNCNLPQLIEKQCKIDTANKTEKDELLKKIINSILNDKNYKIISDIIGEKKKDLYITAPNITCQITSPENQNNNEYNDTSIIKLGKCEEILRDKYNMSKDDKIIILKIDLNEEEYKIPLINYELYNLRTKEILNLSYCDNSSMKTYLPTNDIEENNLDKYNKSSEYYNDICYSYSENSLDITIKDRKIDFNNNNLSLCESNCEYKGYNIETKRSECECKFKLVLSNISDIIDNKDKLIAHFKDIKSIMNLNVIKCFKNYFQKMD